MPGIRRVVFHSLTHLVLWPVRLDLTQSLKPALVASLGLAAFIAANTPAMAASSVVELFTSQGCSSCPPADAIAGKLTSRSGVIVLSMPVDYWDYLGWKDTFAQHAFSERQRLYARERGDGQVYTPQVVVNGLQHAVGSEPDSIDAALAATAAKLRGKQVPIKLIPDASGLTIELGDAPKGTSAAKADVVLADYKSSASVQIGRGENGGHKVTYYHIVRKLTSVGAWDGTAQSIHVANADLVAGGSDGCAVFLQNGSSGPILAAAEMIRK